MPYTVYEENPSSGYTRPVSTHEDKDSADNAARIDNMGSDTYVYRVKRT